MVKRGMNKSFGWSPYRVGLFAALAVGIPASFALWDAGAAGHVFIVATFLATFVTCTGAMLWADSRR